MALVIRTTVLVVTWRGSAHLGACLDALTTQDRPHRIVVVDNAADEATRRVLAEHPARPEVLRLPRNLGYAGGIATALPHVRTPYVAWLNDDAAPQRHWLASLEDALDAQPDVAAATSVLRTPDGQVQSRGVRLTGLGHGADVTEADWAVFGFCGGAVLLRTAALRSAGGVPARFFCYYEDTDTSWRLRLAGWRITTVPTARATHLHGRSSRPGSARFHRWNERNRLLMLVRCAPGAVALRELGRFAALTAVLPFRRNVPAAANFRTGLRLRVLVEVLLGLPMALAARRRIGRWAGLSRWRVWREWAGR